MSSISLLIIPLPFIAFWLWMFWEMANNQRLFGNTRLWWLAMFIVFNVLAAIFYYFTEYQKG